MKRYLIAGFLAWLPLAITISVLIWLLGAIDSLFGVLLTAADAVWPGESRAFIDSLRRIPGLSVVVLAALLLLTGFFVTNIVGRWWVDRWDLLLNRIPIVKSIYSSVKQVSDTLFSTQGNAFREAVLVPYPHAGSWTIAFVTGKPSGEVAALLTDERISVFVPTTPNPTSGFFIMVSRTDVRPLRMSVDQALKYIISMGVVAPPPPAPPPVLPGEADPNRMG